MLILVTIMKIYNCWLKSIHGQNFGYFSSSLIVHFSISPPSLFSTSWLEKKILLCWLSRLLGSRSSSSFAGFGTNGLAFIVSKCRYFQSFKPQAIISALDLPASSSDLGSRPPPPSLPRFQLN